MLGNLTSSMTKFTDLDTNNIVLSNIFEQGSQEEGVQWQ